MLISSFTSVLSFLRRSRLIGNRTIASNKKASNERFEQFTA